VAESRSSITTMTPELWQRLYPLFFAALEKDTQQRAEFVDAACGSDAGLKQQLLLLLRQAEKDGAGILDKPLVEVDAVILAGMQRFQQGETVLGRFHIIRLIGRGGMGEVFEAEDLQLGRIALKTIRPDIAFSASTFDRFRQEVQIARRVSGPQVCRIHELFLIPANGPHAPTPFLTMEYLQGLTLSERLQRDGPLPWKEALPIIADICEGLRLLHKQRLVHRDLKSANVMLCERSGSPHAVLMDFGLARDSIERSSGSDVTTHSTVSVETLSGEIAGTPAYMAPEQFEGQRASAATDIYALGVVIYELLTGTHPYAAATPLEAAIHRAKHPAPVSSIQRKTPRHWDYVIERCLEYESKRRFQTPEEVFSALKAGPASFENLTRDRPWVVRLAGALILAAAAWGILIWWQSSHYYRPNAEGLYWYKAGLTALREGSYLTAAHELERATQEDNGFAMAHARLAETWSNLDFDGRAEREMLIASSGERHLPPLDRTYLDAIRGTLTHDFVGSLALYRQILRRLPATEKPAGYVDLGMAFERVGDPKDALESFALAGRLDKDDAAADMQTAILESKLHNLDDADQAFGRAETVLKAKFNAEGLAELDYERGYLANQREATIEANGYLNKALSEAQQLPDVQLEIRSLTQLSSVAYNSDHDEEAVKFAERAIRLARDNQLDAWSADGLVRLANARLDQGHFQQAEDALHEALNIAHQSHQRREEALANLVLAILRDQQDRPDDVVQPAREALNYYRANGYFEPQAKASLLLIRAQEAKGQLREALTSANSLLMVAKQSGSQDLLVQADEMIGTILLDKESYPDALAHFQRSWSSADKNIERFYEALRCADTLQRLGRYAESNSALESAAALLHRPTTASHAMVVSYTEVRVESFLSQQKYRLALALAGTILADHQDLLAEDRKELELDQAIAEAHLGEAVMALEHLNGLIDRAKKDSKSAEAQLRLKAADVYLASGRPREAYDAANEVQEYFASNDRRDSQLRSVCFAAAASRSLHDSSDAKKFAEKSLDIVSTLQQTWGPQAVRTYLARPDLRLLIRDAVNKHE
jgi:hypothetical protein